MEEKVKVKPAATVDEYLEALPADMKELLEQLRADIKKAAPMAEEIISYRIPTYKYLGPLVHFAAFSKHASLVVTNLEIIKSFAKELKPFKTNGTTIHITPGNPLPASLVRKIVKQRIKENEERQAAKTK